MDKSDKRAAEFAPKRSKKPRELTLIDAETACWLNAGRGRHTVVAYETDGEALKPCAIATGEIAPSAFTGQPEFLTVLQSTGETDGERLAGCRGEARTIREAMLAKTPAIAERLGEDALMHDFLRDMAYALDSRVFVEYGTGGEIVQAYDETGDRLTGPARKPEDPEIPNILFEIGQPLVSTTVEGDECVHHVSYPDGTEKIEREPRMDRATLARLERESREYGG